jgi:hypothetical protein
MPRYKRYGYIVCKREARDLAQGRSFETARNIGFYPNPKAANEHIARIIKNIPKGALAVETENENPLVKFGSEGAIPNGDIIRSVLIMYPDTHLAEQMYTVERWWFEVGRNNE